MVFIADELSEQCFEFALAFWKIRCSGRENTLIEETHGRGRWHSR